MQRFSIQRDKRDTARAAIRDRHPSGTTLHKNRDLSIGNGNRSRDIIASDEERQKEKCTSHAELLNRRWVFVHGAVVFYRVDHLRREAKVHLGMAERVVL